MPKINVYCDESGVENKDKEYYVIGAIFFDRTFKSTYLEGLNRVLANYNFVREIKWRQFGSAHAQLYKDIINYFINQEGLNFRCIVIKKSQVDMDTYHQNDPELAFYKFYYVMLNKILTTGHEHYIFLDHRNNHKHDRVQVLKKFLEAYSAMHESIGKIKHVQAYPSVENRFIQLADLFTGMVSYAFDNKLNSDVKKELISYLAQALGRERINVGTPRTQEKFNIFQISLPRTNGLS